MSTTEAAASRPEAASSRPEARTLHVFVTRGLIAVAWAVVFMAGSRGLTTDVSVGAGILVVLYPVIDVIASLSDARIQEGSARRLLLANATVSAVAAIALGVAATGTVANVVAVFGAWAVVSGGMQVVVALHRNARLGHQWPMILSGLGSVIFGAVYLSAAAGDRPRLSVLAIYGATGGLDFLIQAGVLALHLRSQQRRTPASKGRRSAQL